MVSRENPEDRSFDEGDSFTKDTYKTFPISIGIYVRREDLIKISLVNEFVCNFIFFCQAIWVFSLVELFKVPFWAQTALWTFPFFISQKIKQPLLEYSKRTPNKMMHRTLTIILISYSFVTLGLFLIAFSTFPQLVLDFAQMTTDYNQLRVVLFSIGWVFLNTPLEIIYTLNDEIQAIMINNPSISWDPEEISMVRIISKTIACVTSLISLLRVSNPRDFYNSMFQVFRLCCLLCLSAFMIIRQFNNFKTVPKQRVSKEPIMNKQILNIASLPQSQLKEESENSSKNKMKPSLVKLERVARDIIKSNRIKQIFNQTMDYLKNIYVDRSVPLGGLMKKQLHLLRIPSEQKMFLFVYWIKKVLEMGFQLYITCWVVELIGESQPVKNYRLGLGVGAVFLCLFQILNTITTYLHVKDSWPGSLSNKNKEYYDGGFILLSVLLTAAYLYLWMYQNIFLFVLALCLTSILISNLEIFLEFDQMANSKLHIEYQQSQSSVFCYAKYFVYFWCPFFWNYIKNNNKKLDGLLLISVLIGILVLIKMYYFRIFKSRGKKDLDISNVNLIQTVSRNFMFMSASMSTCNRNSKSSNMNFSTRNTLKTDSSEGQY